MVIFDLDGTLWDSASGVAECWSTTIMNMMGIETHFTIEDIHGIMGWPMDEIAEKMVPSDDPEVRREVFKACEAYENQYLTEHGGQLYPGVRETLQQLKDSGRKMAIVSNCQTGYIKAFLDSMNMHEYFCDLEEWGNTLQSKGHNIRLVMERNGVTDAIYVGDIQKDKNAADEAGIPCILANYGFGDMENPAAVMDSFDQLPAILEQLGY